VLAEHFEAHCDSNDQVSLNMPNFERQISKPEMAQKAGEE